MNSPLRRRIPDVVIWVSVIAFVALPLAAPGLAKRGGGGTGNGRRDTLPPKVTISTPTPGNVVAGSVTVAGTASDAGGIASVSVAVDSGPYSAAGGTTSWAKTIDVTGLSNATHVVTSKAADLAGNTSTSTVTVLVSNNVTPADTTAPMVSIASPQNGQGVSAGAISVTGNAADNAAVTAVTVSVDGGIPIPAIGTTSWTAVTGSLGAGSHAITARASDGAGNVGVSTVTVTVTATVPPGTGSDVIVTDPAATGPIDPVLRTRLLQYGNLTGFIYLDQTAYRPSVYFRDAVARA